MSPCATPQAEPHPATPEAELHPATVDRSPGESSAPLPDLRSPKPPRASGSHRLEPDALWGYVDQLYRAAWALSGSKHDAEDLVQETFLNVLKRPRLLREGRELGYLLRALRNTYASRYRRAAHRGTEQELTENDGAAHQDSDVSAREIMEAIAGIPAPYRDAVIAVDLVGLSYREAAQSLATGEATITTRVYRGRQHIARNLLGEPA
jgi:RNA polymerase sigma-70 factor (ECF subfamily)